jgi:hypothetical protein
MLYQIKDRLSLKVLCYDGWKPEKEASNRILFKSLEEAFRYTKLVGIYETRIFLIQQIN